MFRDGISTLLLRYARLEWNHFLFYTQKTIQPGLKTRLIRGLYHTNRLKVLLVVLSLLIIKFFYFKKKQLFFISKRSVRNKLLG